MKKSLSQQLYDHLYQSGKLVHGADLERFGMSLGFMADNVGRRLRELRKARSVESINLHYSTGQPS